MTPATIENRVVPQLIECVEKISTSSSVEYRKSFRSRARGMPADLFSRGLAYMLTYAAARSSATAIEVGLTANSCEELINNVKNMKLKSEEYGYATYGALVLYSLKQANLVSRTKFSDIVKEALTNYTLNTHAMLIAEWIKRLAEAYIEA